MLVQSDSTCSSLYAGGSTDGRGTSRGVSKDACRLLNEELRGGYRGRCFVKTDGGGDVDIEVLKLK